MISSEKMTDSEFNNCGLSELKEIDELLDIIKQLCAQNLSESSMEINHERFNFIIKQYQDQPQLLDPYLESILNPLIAAIRNQCNFNNSKHHVFKYLYIIISVKTLKKIVIYLPHEVNDLLPVLKMIENQDPSDKDNWQTRYVLLVWLSVICKIPFALARLDSEEEILVNNNKNIISRLMDVCKLYCNASDACFPASVFLLINFLDRPDVMKESYLDDIISWAINRLQMDALNYRPLAVLASVLKHYNQQELLPRTQLIIDNILMLKTHTSAADCVRKYSLKIIQRIGLVHLRTRQTGSGNHTRISNEPIELSTCTVANEAPEIQESVDKEMEQNDAQEEVPPLIEDILEILIRSLQDKTTMIRWSSAKGIGRVAAHLSYELGDDILGYVLNLFLLRESETAWHGGCLALAELGRRGLLLPNRLKDIIPLVLQALIFDEPKAYGPGGSIIRDAACYVCWSFSRAFDPEIFLPFVNEVVRTLLLVTCFDREINCRRAASAALQEIVGREGNFPHGLEIITIADYFEVGTRNNAYINISGKIAGDFDEYVEPFINHLIDKKIIHWDEAIREVTSKALHNLIKLNVDLKSIDDVISRLLVNLNSIDLNVRHGSILAIAEIILALYEKYNKDITHLLDENKIERIRNIVATSKSRGHLRGLGGELIKQGCVLLIKHFSIIHLSIKSVDEIFILQNLLEDCLSNESKSLRTNAAEAHLEFLNEYYFQLPEDYRSDMLTRYIDNLSSNNQINRTGYAQAVGSFPKIVLQEKLEDIISSLIICSHKNENSLFWAESRKEALQSLTNICFTLNLKDSKLWEPFMLNILNCFLTGLIDYTIDNRGDIGSWVREASMNGLHKILYLINKSEYKYLLNEKIMHEIAGNISKQAVERIDRTRALAGNIFFSLVHSDLPNIPSQNDLKILFPYDCASKLDWKLEKDTFPLFIKMLSYTQYINYILSGVIYSVGGISESLVKHSSSAFFFYMQQADVVSLRKICDEITNIFEISHKDDRMIPSILSFLDRLFNSGCMERIICDCEKDIYEKWLKLLKKESKHIHSAQCQLNIIKIYCHLLQIQDNSVSKAAFCQLSIYLCHKFKFLRKATALRLYEALTLYGEDMNLKDSELTVLLNQLNSTDWEKPVEELRPIRNQLCNIMGSPVPVRCQKKTAQQ